LTSAKLTVHRVLHPILISQRDAAGDLLEITASRVSASSRLSPSGILDACADRPLSDAERAEAIEEVLRQALADVRAVVHDGGALTGAAPRSRPTPQHLLARSAQEVSETATSCTG